VIDDGRTKIVGRKITLADWFRTAEHRWHNSYPPGSNLPVKIEALFKEIQGWQAADKVQLKSMRSAEN
jgi:hypothetical protein